MDDTMQVLNIVDDSITAEGVNPLQRQYFTQPGVIALFIGLKGRPTKKISTDLNLVYFQWDAEKSWEYLDGMVSQTRCVPTTDSSEKGTCSNPVFTDGVADGHGLISTVDDEMGWELNGAVTYDYNKHVKLTISAAVFWPGDGAEVVAQCANFASGAHVVGSAGTQDTAVGCHDDVPAALAEGESPIQVIHGIARANDEAFNIDTELLVQF
jgi:hypothetical protein